jgi:ABC-2 type transport system permease protein
MNKWLQNNELLTLIGAHFKDLIREPAILFWGIIFPILMSLGLGVAFTKKTDITRKVAVVNNFKAGNALSDSSLIIGRFLNLHVRQENHKEDERTLVIPDEQLGNTTLIFQQKNWDEAIVLLKRGTLTVIMEEKEGHIVYHFDPLNPDAQLTFLKLSGLFGKNETRTIGTNQKIQPLTLTGTRYIDFFIPGLIAMGAMTACMWGISYTIIEKRSKKLLRRMVATPMKRSNFLISLITVRIIMNFIESGLLLLFAWWAFHITIQGNIPALLILFLSGNIAFAGLSVVLSCRTDKTEVGNGFINAITLPMMVLSGIFFSYYNFPEWSIPYIQKLPLTLLADGIRSIFIEGGGFGVIAWPSIILTSFGVLFFAIGLKVFKWY